MWAQCMSARGVCLCVPSLCVRALVGPAFRLREPVLGADALSHGGGWKCPMERREAYLPLSAHTCMQRAFWCNASGFARDWCVSALPWGSRSDQERPRIAAGLLEPGGMPHGAQESSESLCVGEQVDVRTV